MCPRAYIRRCCRKENDTHLINATISSSQVNGLPGDIRRVISKSAKRSVNIALMEYKVSFHKASFGRSMSQIDRGANRGVAGYDVRIIFRTNRPVDIKGIDNHHVNDIGIGTVGGVVKPQNTVLSLSYCTNMHYLARDLTSIRHVNWNGTRTR
jgi:hypothetical protein